MSKETSETKDLSPMEEHQARRIARAVAHAKTQGALTERAIRALFKESVLNPEEIALVVKGVASLTPEPSAAS